MLALSVSLCRLDPVESKTFIPLNSVVDAMRAHYLSTGASPNVRKLAKLSGQGTKAIYQLFKKAPGSTAARVAGVPQPAPAPKFSRSNVTDISEPAYAGQQSREALIAWGFDPGHVDQLAESGAIKQR